jgi:hypothetical protein
MDARMPCIPGMLCLTRRRAAQLFDREARRNLGMSGEEFARRYRVGKVEDLDHSAASQLAILLPWADY